AFVPPWMRLRGRLTALVRDETDRLGRDVDAALGDPAVTGADATPPRTLAQIGERMHVALSLLRIDHLERLHGELGKSEAQAVIIRLLAPVATVAWRLARGG